MGCASPRDIYYPARDGKRLEGKFPAILERTPYNKGGRFHGMPPYPWQPFYASHGYVCISQDTRGRFKSEGTWHMMTDDVADGFDTAQWLVEQPWSDGGFGMIGTSYVGGTQHAMALANPPGLKTLVPVDAVVDAGYFGMRYGGAWELRFTNWIFSMAAPEGSRASRDPATHAALDECARDVRRYISNLPIRKGATPLRLAPEYEEWIVHAMSHGENDAYWKQPGFGLTHNIDAYKDVPVFLVGGWYDSWARQTTMSYAALSKNKRGPVRMILGPWIHGSHMMSMHGDTDFGASAAIDGLEFRLRWYDRWLKGIQNGVENDAPVKIFVMGGGSEATGPDGRHLHGGVWRDEQEWPLARTRFTPYYLHGDRSLSSREAARGEQLDHLRLRSARPGPHHRRQHFLGDGNHAAGRVGSDWRSAHLEPHGGSPPFIAPRRDRFHDAAAHRRPRGHRPYRREAVGVIVRARHRFHREAHRRASADARTIPRASR